MSVEIKHRYSGEVIATGDTILEAVKGSLADLRGADLGGAYLRGAKGIWQSHDILSEILRRSAGDDVAKLKVAGLVLIQRGWCWRKMLAEAARDPLGGWALDELRKWIVEGDDTVPQALVAKEGVSDATS